MLNFHYSDSWADPGTQTKPTAWAAIPYSELKDSVYQYTRRVMQALKQNNIVPQWVQIGNEINNRLLWEEGKATSHPMQLAELLKSGIRAVREEAPQTKIIINVSNGYDSGLYNWFFDILKNNGVVYDVIGMSLYPTAENWRILNQQCMDNMQQLLSRYNKEIVIAEVGMEVKEADSCKAFLLDLMNKCKQLPNQKGLGVFYWEPQCYNNWKGYTKGAFNTLGRPTRALDAFSEFR